VQGIGEVVLQLLPLSQSSAINLPVAEARARATRHEWLIAAGVRRGAPQGGAFPPQKGGE